MNDYSGGEEETHAKAFISKLRQIDMLIAHGRQVADAVRSLGVTDVHIIDGEMEYGGLKGAQVKRLRDK